MRRPPARATAACAAYALVLSLGTAAPAAADEEAPAATGGTAAPGERGAAWERGGDPGGTAAADEETRGPTGDRGASAADGSNAPARLGGDRTEAGSSLWTYVDHAFPDRSYSGTETASVGTGRLAWDRVYTRRSLFRFPVEPTPGTTVESAVLRVQVVWSYDCGSDSHMQLHRVDPFDGGASWDGQPTVRALLDTRNVRGGRAECPVNGGVEFDVTEAYRQAAENGEPHLHLRLAERDESGSTAWRRFDVEDDPPVLVVDHRAPRTPGTASAPSGPPGDSPDGAADAGPSGDPDPVQDEDSPALFPTRLEKGPTPADGHLPPAGGSDGVRVQGRVGRVFADRFRTGGAHSPSLRRERADRPTSLGGHRHRRRGRNTVPGPRGPPATAPAADRTPVERPRRTG